MWSEQEQNTLIAMWRDGQSAATIAPVVGRTRNAVLGRLHRLRHVHGVELPLKPRTAVRKRKSPHLVMRSVRPVVDMPKRAKPAKPACSPRNPRVLPPVEPARAVLQLGEVEPNGIPTGLVALCNAACRWPVPSEAPVQHFCNRVRRSDSPYCEEHAAKAGGVRRG